MFCRGVAPPTTTSSTLCDLIRELCCTQIELSEWLPFNPPFQAKNTQTHCRVTVEHSDTHTHTQNGDCEGALELVGPV